MWKYTVEVRGMMCAMCESHVNDAVRRALRVKSVRSSRAKNETVVLAEQALDEAALRDAIAATGYEVGGVSRAARRHRRHRLRGGRRYPPAGAKGAVRLEVNGGACAAQGFAGGPWPSPTSRGEHRGQPGNRIPAL